MNSYDAAWCSAAQDIISCYTILLQCNVSSDIFILRCSCLSNLL